MKNCLTRKNEKMCDPISSNSTENATPSSGTSPLASYKGVPLPRAEIDNRGKPGFKYYKHIEHSCVSPPVTLFT